MTILTETSERVDDTHYFTGSCEAARAFVAIDDDGGVRVCCMNAAHKVWRGPGRFFDSADAAIDGYKSGNMKALIRAAVAAAAESALNAKGAEK